MSRNTLVAILLAGSGILAPATGTTVHGRLELYLEEGLVPASYIRLHLASSRDTLGPVLTGSDGVFIFSNVPPGSYSLLLAAEVQRSSGHLRLRTPVPGRQRDTPVPVRSFPIRVRHDASRMTLETILLNRLDFTEPGDDTYTDGDVVTVSGTHSFPEDAPVWLLLRQADREFLPRGYRLDLGEDDRWAQDGIRLEAGVAELVAVLVTPDGDEWLRNRTRAATPRQFAELPSESRIIRARRLTVR